MPINFSLSRNQLAWLVLATWLLAMLLAFWLLVFRHIQSIDLNHASFMAADLELQLNRGQVQVLHMVDEDCPCSRFSTPHIKSIQEKFSRPIYGRMYQNGRIEGDVSLTDRQLVQIHALVPASPSVLIFSEEGHLAYFGPYSSGAVCGEGEDLVARMLSLLSTQSNPEWLNQEAVGCFCPWQVDKQSA